MDRVFPYLIIGLDILACGCYFAYGDYRRGVYWLSAAVLTICVTGES